MLFCNISSDKIQFILDGEETIVEHVDLEKTMAHFLTQLKTENGKLKTDKVLIINGPGSFTNLRICTLALNMYNFLNDNILDFYSIDKLSLYKKLYQKKIIPALGYIYIGQKKNRRMADLQTNTHEQILIQEADTTNCFIDYIFDHSQFEGFNSQLVSLRREGEELVVNYNEKNSKIALSELGITPTKSVEANYMMEANVTLLTKK